MLIYTFKVSRLYKAIRLQYFRIHMNATQVDCIVWFYYACSFIPRHNYPSFEVLHPKKLFSVQHC